MLMLFFGVTVVEYFIDNLVLASHGIQPGSKLLVEIRVVTAISNLVILGMGLFTGLVLDWFYQHRLAREIRMEQVQTELDLLKSRINPHFLFNVLNGIFYMAHKKGDEETADAIARLSQMMRYMLQEVSRERVPLEGELEYLENFVAMQRMRLAHTIPIEFSIQGQPGSITVPPMMLLPFVENAFKHGVSNANPTPITIQIQIGEGRLDLSVDNHVHPCAEQETGGFGLRNAQRRLELLYPGKHHLETGERGGRYRVRLSLEGDDGVVQNAGEKPSIIKKEQAP